MGHIENVLRSKGVRIATIDNQVWFVAKDVCDIIGIKDAYCAINGNVSRKPTKNINSGLDPNSKRIVDVVVSGKARQVRKIIVINEHGVKSLLSRTRKPQAIPLIKELDIELIEITKEQSTLHVVKSAFSHIKSKYQYPVGNYYIDFYLPDYKLAIECDEFNHCGRDLDYEIQRENYIKSKLGCKFIRYNPDEKDFNVGDVINKIMVEIYGNKIQ